MNVWLSLLLGVFVVLVITGGTAFFVAQEFAYMAVDRSRLAASTAQGDTGAARVLDITSRTSFMLSGAQLGITVTGLLVGYVAEPLIGVALADMLGGSSTGWALGVGSVVALLFSTVVQMLFGELLPKNFAISRPDESARWLARPTRIYLALMKPLIWFFDKAAELLLRAMRIEPVHDVEHAATATDLARVVERSRDSGEIGDELSMMIDRIIDFPRQDVGHAMIARNRVDSLPSTTTLAQVRTAMSTGSSRYPVLDADANVVGVVHLLDVLGAPGSDDTLVTDLVRPALVVPELMRLPAALSLMRYEREPLACVVDEFGGFTGILTIEDIAEEIVGEITDEHDPDDLDEEPMEEDGVWCMNGDVHVDEVERALRLDLPEGEYETIAGLVIHAFGALPQPGQSLDIPLPLDTTALLADAPAPLALHVEVLEIANHVPSRVRLTVHGRAPVDEATDATGDQR